jgi:hypothetical protein
LAWLVLAAKCRYFFFIFYTVVPPFLFFFSNILYRVKNGTFDGLVKSALLAGGKSKYHERVPTSTILVYPYVQ